MNMIRIAICDDEKNIRLYLSRLIKKQNIDCTIAEYAHPDDFLSAHRETDLLFLDIRLNDSGRKDISNGMDLAKEIRSRESGPQPLIIFVTGYDSYVFDAFDVGAFQYLMKPIDEDKFADVFRRAVKQILDNAGKRKTSLTVSLAGTRKIIPLEQIYYMESHGHKIVLHLKDGILEYYGKIGTMEQELQGQFCRIHKGYLVNLSYVESYDRTEVTLTSGRRLNLSKYKYDSFVKMHLQFIS